MSLLSTNQMHIIMMQRIFLNQALVVEKLVRVGVGSYLVLVHTCLRINVCMCVV